MNNDTLRELIQLASTRSSGILYEGWQQDDQNLPGNILIVQSEHEIYSFSKNDVLDQEQLPNNATRVRVRSGASAFRMSSFSVGSQAYSFTVGMEELAPPAPTDDPTAPLAAKVHIEPEAPALFAPPSLPNVGANWSNQCVGGDDYPNDCAHFLSDAFIRAGYTELLPPNSHINARCPAKRPIRARDMWSWFSAKAVRSSRTITRNTGWWAIFQLNESVYWGGHVVVLDSDAWLYYGTGWFGDWNQYLYQF